MIPIRSFHMTLLLAGLLGTLTAHATTTNFVARYAVSVTVDTSRNTEAAASVKALKGGLWLIGGALDAGALVDEVSFSDRQYRILTHSEPSSVLKMLTSTTQISRQSDGRIFAKPFADRFIERKGNKEATVVTMNYARREAIYTRGKEVKKTEAMPAALSDSALLPYSFYRRPIPAKGPVVINATDGISTRQLILDRHEENVDIAGQSIPAVKWTRRLGNASDPSFELWIRKTDGLPLRFRLGLSARYGAVLEQKLQSLPLITTQK